VHSSPASSTQDISPDLQKCLKSLAFPGMEDRSHDIEDAVTGTCRWLREHETYISWKTSDRALLWIKGKPGSGKSTLLKYATRNHKVEEDALIFSFFFHGRGDELQKTPLGLFRSLAHQLLWQAPSAASDILEAFNKKLNEIGETGKNWQWHHRELGRLLDMSLIKLLKARSISLFIDALDECGRENAVGLVEKFKALLENSRSQGASSSKFQICFSCRHYPILDLDGILDICLENENHSDISAFLDSRLSEFCTRMSSTIPNLIKERASGVFLWVRLVVDHILHLERTGYGLKKIETALYRIPQDLSDLYRELLRDMEPASLKLIQWILFATRPLSLDELRWAMVIEPSCPHTTLQSYRDVENYASDANAMKRQIQTLSCGLVEASRLSTISMAFWPRTTVQMREVVQFIHQSVKDFFLESGLSMLQSSLTNDRAVRLAHLRLSQICIRYLTMEEISRWPEDKSRYSISQLDIIPQSADKYICFPFLHYATTSWISHSAKGDDGRISQEPLLDLFGWPSKTYFELWLHCFRNINKNSRDCPPDDTNLLHIAARFGISGLLSCMLCRSDQVSDAIDIQDGASRTPLSWAAEGGFVDIIKLLLGNGAQVDIKDKGNWTPLLWAADGGHAGAAWVLIRYGANVNYEDNNHRTALLWAAGRGNMEVVRSLIVNGAEIDTQDDYGQTPLAWAAEGGHIEVVRLLTENGAKVDPQDRDCYTPLLRAMEGGYIRVLGFLLEKGANIELEDMYGRTPLLRAVAGRGDIEVVRTLIENGAAVDHRDRDGYTPLLRAVEAGHIEKIRFLIEEGAKVDTKDQHGDTPLLKAIKGASIKVAILLVRSGATVDLKDNNRETALLCGTKRGYTELVRLLIEKGAEIDGKDASGRTALSWAAAGRFIDTMFILIKKGADLESKDDTDRTPLSWAAQSGRGEVLRFLISMGAKVDSKDNCGRAPLSWLAGGDHTEGHQLLIDNAAEVESEENTDRMSRV
jgi:ankyrin repeat protein